MILVFDIKAVKQRINIKILNKFLEDGLSFEYYIIAVNEK